MFTEYVEHDTEDHFCDSDACIGGMALVRITCSHEMNGDIGGDDGRVVDATLIHVKIGGLIITADQLAEAFGAKFVVSFEDKVVEMENDA
jgi:hypothetical protein